MVKYEEILRLTVMGISQRNAAFSVGCAAPTVQDVLRAAKVVGLEWPLPDEMDDVTDNLKLPLKKMRTITMVAANVNGLPGDD